MRITDAGNVGIGTTTPAANLHIAGVGTYGPQLFLDATTSGTGGRISQLGSKSDADGVGGGNFIIRDNTAGVVRLLVNSSGNVGIGTSSPLSKLHVAGGKLFLGDVGTDFSSATSYFMGREQYGSYTVNSGFSQIDSLTLPRVD